MNKMKGIIKGKKLTWIDAVIGLLLGTIVIAGILCVAALCLIAAQYYHKAYKKAIYNVPVIIFVILSGLVKESFTLFMPVFPALKLWLDDRRIDDRYLTSNVATWGADNTDYWNDVLNCIREDGYVYLYDITEEVQEALGQYMADEFVEQALYVAVDENGELRLKRAW